MANLTCFKIVVKEKKLKIFVQSYNLPQSEYQAVDNFVRTIPSTNSIRGCEVADGYCLSEYTKTKQYKDTKKTSGLGFSRNRFASHIHIAD